MRRESSRRLYFSSGVGSTFADRRRELGLSLADAAAGTRIKEEYLESIEQASFESLQHNAYTLGFIKRYANFLGLDSGIATKRYLLERGELEGKGAPEELKPPHTFVTTIFIRAALISLISLLALSYIGWQVWNFFSPPPLEITNPVSESTVVVPDLTVEGRTEPEIAVSINGSLLYSDEEGYFKLQVPLQPGINTLNIDAKDNRGKTSHQVRYVLFETADTHP